MRLLASIRHVVSAIWLTGMLCTATTTGGCMPHESVVERGTPAVKCETKIVAGFRPDRRSHDRLCPKQPWGPRSLGGVSAPRSTPRSQADTALGRSRRHG